MHSRRVVVSYKRKYVHKLLVNRLLKPAQEKSVVKWTDRPAMTIAVDMGRKATKTNKTYHMPLDKSVCTTNNVLISQPKHMLGVRKITVLLSTQKTYQW